MVEDLAAVLRMWEDQAAAADLGQTIPGGRAMRFVTPVTHKVEIVDLAALNGLPPVRKQGEFHFTEMASFVRFVNDHKTGASSIFAANDYGFEAFLNGHEPESAAAIVPTGEGGNVMYLPQAGHYDFTAHFSPKPTRAWQAWRGVANRPLTQAQFAELIEERMGEILRPSGAQLYEIATALKVHTAILFDSKVKISNGQVQLTYREEVESGGGVAGDLVIPERLILLLSPFEGVAPEEVSIRLRMAVKDGKASWLIVLGEEAEELRERHFDVMSQTIAQRCEVPLYRGSCSV